MSGPAHTSEEDATAHELTPATERHVRLVVCEHAHDAADARRLLEMLGFIEPPEDA